MAVMADSVLTEAARYLKYRNYRKWITSTRTGNTHLHYCPSLCPREQSEKSEISKRRRLSANSLSQTAVVWVQNGISYDNRNLTDFSIWLGTCHVTCARKHFVCPLLSENVRLLDTPGGNACRDITLSSAELPRGTKEERKRARKANRSYGVPAGP